MINKDDHRLTFAISEYEDVFIQSERAQATVAIPDNSSSVDCAGAVFEN